MFEYVTLRNIEQYSGKKRRIDTFSINNVLTDEQSWARYLATQYRSYDVDERVMPRVFLYLLVCLYVLIYVLLVGMYKKNKEKVLKNMPFHRHEVS